MLSDDASFSDNTISCPDCKQELIERKWTHVLLNWFNNCVLPGRSAREITLRVLMDVLQKYKDDICDDDLEQALLYSDDLEPFLVYKYPILRLRNLQEAKDYPRKLYIMASVVLYHCCVSSRTSAVEDICKNMGLIEQELMLKYCENLGEMEVTVNNVDAAVAAAFDRKGLLFNKPKPKTQDKPKEKVPTNTMEKFEKTLQNVTTTKCDNTRALKFKSSVTVLSSAEISSREMSDMPYGFLTHSHTDYGDESMVKVYNFKEMEMTQFSDTLKAGVEHADGENHPECSCLEKEGSAIGGIESNLAAGDSFTPKIASGMAWQMWSKKKCSIKFGYKMWILLFAILIGIISAVVSTIHFTTNSKETNETSVKAERRFQRDDENRDFLTPDMHWECRNDLCQKLHQRSKSRKVFPSLSRCTLVCTGPQLWPHPIGYTYYSKQLIATATNKLEYKFQSVPSTPVQQYLANAFNLFLKDLTKLERNYFKVKNETQDLPLKKIYIQMVVESDADPRMRLDTEESYSLQIDTLRDQVKVAISSLSFCGVRHGLETLSQLILLDQSTGFLITLSRVEVRDGPSYKYRGLMIDTARNYIPVPDLLRTIDAMSSCKLNTFHWRISDPTSFPMLVPEYPQLFEFGGYDRSMVYAVEDITALVNRAGLRGIRVLLEVALPGPVGRAWSWTSDATCKSTNANLTCDNTLCLRLKMTETILSILEGIYTFILEVTKVDDIFHMSDSMFSFLKCNYLLDDRQDFLDKALARLKYANKGFLPKLPIIWHTSHLLREYEMNTWEKYGVQLNEWQPNINQYLRKFKVIHSSKWDLTCEIRKRRCRKYRTWQEMYAWKSWRNLEVLTIEGGEAILWTDLVDSSNLDTHLWPRAAAVAERLWSDVMANHTPGASEYLRLDAHSWRLLLRSVKVQPVWPVWCSFNPWECLKKIM